MRLKSFYSCTVPAAGMVCFAPLKMVSSSFCSLSQFSSIICSLLRTPRNCQNIDDASKKQQQRAAPSFPTVSPWSVIILLWSCVPERNLKRLDLAVRGFTVNESSASQGAFAAGCRYYLLDGKDQNIIWHCSGSVTLHLSFCSVAGFIFLVLNDCHSNN